MLKLCVPENVLKLLKLGITVEFRVLLLKGALLHEIHGPVSTSWSCDRRTVMLLMDTIEFLTHLVKFKKLLGATLLSLQELLGELRVIEDAKRWWRRIEKKVEE